MPRQRRRNISQNAVHKIHEARTIQLSHHGTVLFPQLSITRQPRQKPKETHHLGLCDRHLWVACLLGCWRGLDHRIRVPHVVSDAHPPRLAHEHALHESGRPSSPLAHGLQLQAEPVYHVEISQPARAADVDLPELAQGGQRVGDRIVEGLRQQHQRTTSTRALPRKCTHTHLQLVHVLLAPLVVGRFKHVVQPQLPHAGHVRADRTQ
ncbi:unnamed protein product [Mycena citricolor]|uniref:Uncharacterized protein n=1 Tax=Mycena citricolor TaxID=2018698 RepID=A0AAD2Q7K7_9AGAR|nr:unnamed protein product [Mycena citricolor]CAK5284831.1 unnamed protein product [Mycena citricolor]